MRGKEERGWLLQRTALLIEEAVLCTLTGRHEVEARDDHKQCRPACPPGDHTCTVEPRALLWVRGNLGCERIGWHLKEGQCHPRSE